MQSEDFEDVEEIGGGAFGKLYKAHQQKLGRDVALKVVDASIEGSPDALAHAKAMAKVEHENIVKIFSFENFDLLNNGESQDVIVMQWLPGETLEVCLAGERLSETDAIFICTGVINGLIALHNGNVAHGDLHCRNIMIVDGRPVIIDVHPVEQAFLSQQSLTSREAKISQDIGFCRTVVVRTLRHSMSKAVTTANFDTNLVRAGTLEEIKKVVEGFADGSMANSQSLGLEASTLASAPDETIAAEIKSLISAPSGKIQLHDRVVAETRNLLALLNADEFSPALEYSDEDFLTRLGRYDEITRRLAVQLSCIAHWGDTSHVTILAKAIERIAGAIELTGGKTIWLSLRWYPVELLLYATGIAAVSSDSYATLNTVLRLQCADKNSRTGSKKSIAKSVTEGMLELRRSKAFNTIPGKERSYVPRSEHLYECLQPTLDDLLFLGESYDANFDQFEILKSLSYMDIVDRSWALVGRFGWKDNNRFSESGPLSAMIREAESQQENWPPLKSGFLSSIKRFEQLSTSLQEHVEKLGWF